MKSLKLILDKSVVYRRQVLLLGIIFFVLLIMKIETLALPFFWDEMGVYAESLYLLCDNFTHILNVDAFYNHPPGIQLMFYPWCKISQGSIFVVRLISLLCSYGSVVMLYVWARKMHDDFFAFIVSFIFVATPIFYVICTRFLGDNIYTFLAMLYTYLAITDRDKGAFFVGLYVGICRESSIAFGVGLFTYYLMTRQISIKKLLISFAPIMMLLGYYGATKIITGRAFGHQAFTYGHIDFSFSNYAERISDLCHHIFVNNYLVISLVLIGLSLVLIFLHMIVAKESKLKIIKQNWALLIMMTVVILEFICFFAINSGTLLRYFLPIIPFLYIISLHYIYIFSRRILPLISLGVCICFFSSYYYGNDPDQVGTGHEADMQYVEVTQLFQTTAHYVEQNYSGKTIFAPWPIFHIFQYPFMGYVQKGFNYVAQAPWQNKYFAKGNYDIFIWGNNSDIACVGDKDRYVQQENLILAKRFSNNGKVIEIYEKKK